MLRTTCECFSFFTAACRIHAVYLADAQAVDPGEAVGQVRLHCGRVARLSQDLHQVVVGQEVEAGEQLAPRVQVDFQGPLDLLQVPDGPAQVLWEP